MRKAVLLAGLLLIVFVFALPALAVPAHRAVFVIGQNSYTADGQEKTMDAAPFIENGRTYVPVRYLALTLGVKDSDIAWDEKTGTVTLRLNDVMIVGSRTLLVNGLTEAMDVAPLIKNGRTYVFARPLGGRSLRVRS